MSLRRVIGLCILIIGLVILIYGGFSYTNKSQAAKIGSLELSVDHKKTVYIPIWVGIIVAASGGAMLLIKPKK